MITKLIFQVVIISLCIVGCSPPAVDSKPSKVVAETDLIGSWELFYKGKVVSDNPDGRGFGSERIDLLPEGRYEQTFDDGSGGTYPKTQSTWKLTKNRKGQQVVDLDGMRNYKDGVANAVTSPPRPSTSLVVQASSSVPFVGKSTLILCFDEADVNLCFGRSPETTR